ncbi:MAG: DUF819 family protein [Leptospirales bacterium]|jgi:uncharacterized membrane protein
MYAVAQIIFLIGFPLLAILLAGRFKVFNVIGPVVLCYVGGVLLALSPGVSLDSKLSESLSEAVVPLAIPLLLFSMDFMSWLRFARGAVISFSLALISVVIMSILGFYALGHTVENAPQLSGMLIGVYTGGTPNMAALGNMLDVPNDTYLLMQTSDVLLGGIYLLFLLSVARRFVLLFLKPFQHPDGGTEDHVLDSHDVESLNRRDLPPILKGFGLSALIVVLSAGVAIGFGSLTGAKGSFVPLVMLGLTGFAILASLNVGVRALRGTYESGEYLILIFCVAMGSLVDPTSLFTTGTQFLQYCGFVMIGAIILHMFFGWIFRVDADTLLVTSTAAIYGPPFVPAICDSLKNRHLLISGLTTGLVGYAVGTPLGWVVAQFLSG